MKPEIMHDLTAVERRRRIRVALAAIRAMGEKAEADAPLESSRAG